MALIAFGIFTFSYLVFMAIAGPYFALYLSVATLLICWRVYSTVSGTNSFMKELNEQTNLKDIYYKEFLHPEGKRLENDFCIVEIVPKRGYCYITEKQILPTNGYHKIEIKNSYKTGDFYGAIFDIFTPQTTYDTLKNLAQLFEIYYKESFIEAMLNVEEKKEEEVKFTMPALQVNIEEEHPTMPVLKVDIEEPKIDTEPEIKYNEEREVDL